MAYNSAKTQQIWNFFRMTLVWPGTTELCKVDNLANEEELDVATQNIRNEYASKMLLLFLPFRGIEEIPLFEEFSNDSN